MNLQIACWLIRLFAEQVLFCSVSKEGDDMKRIIVLLFALSLPSCREHLSQSKEPVSWISAYVHWQDQGVAGKQIVLVQTGDTLRTDSKGLAEFSVPAGHYVIRALEINRGGPCCRSIDFDVETKPGDTTKVDIVDCLPCV